MPVAVSPPALTKVDYQIYLNEAFFGKLVVPACFLNTIMSIGVTHPAIAMLDASEAISMLTN